MKNSYLIITAIALVVIAVIITCSLFETRIAEMTIDWLAFLAGIFLVVEGLARIILIKDPVFPDQILRAVRVVIGACVFTIHLLQFMRY